jgi:hypothetical protein
MKRGSNDAPTWMMLPHLQEPDKCYTSDKLDMMVPHPGANFVPGQQEEGRPVDKGTLFVQLAGAGISDRPNNTVGFHDMKNKGAFHRKRNKGDFGDFVGHSGAIQHFICGPGSKNCFDSADFRPVVANKDINHKPRSRTLRSTDGAKRLLMVRLELKEITPGECKTMINILKKKEADLDDPDFGLHIPVESSVQRWPESKLCAGPAQRNITARARMPFGPSATIHEQPKRLWDGDATQEGRVDHVRNQAILTETKRGLTKWNPVPPQERKRRHRRVRTFRHRLKRQMRDNARETKRAIDKFETMLEQVGNVFCAPRAGLHTNVHTMFLQYVCTTSDLTSLSLSTLKTCGTPGCCHQPRQQVDNLQERLFRRRA